MLQGLPPFWASVDQEDGLHLRLPAAESSDDVMIEWLTGPLPQHFVNVADPLHHGAGPGSLVQWLMKSPFLDPRSGAMFGGRYGLRIAGLMLLRMAVIIRELQTNSTSYPPEAGNLDHRAITAFTVSINVSLRRDIQRSVALMQPSAHARRLDKLPETIFHDMLKTPESREAAPITPMEGAEHTMDTSHFSERYQGDETSEMPSSSYLV